MMNRTAENLFWIGRYLERAENYTRLIDVNYHMRHELKSPDNEYLWERLIASIGDIHFFKEHFEHANETTALQFLTFEPINQNSLFSCIYFVRNNMRALRQLLPGELWDIMNEFYLWLNEQNLSSMMMQSPYNFFQHSKECLSLFNGTAYSTMVRNHEWNFFQSGKFLESAENTVRILQSIYSNFTKDSLLLCNHAKYNRLIVLLKSVGGYEAFRKVYADDVTLANVIEFLILNPIFPRSVRYSLSNVETFLMKIKKQDYQFDLLAEKAIELVIKLKQTLAGLEGENYESVGLGLILDMLESINRLGVIITKTFFQEEFVYE
jgi:uncharacterized alpha-E superfamily protein